MSTTARPSVGQAPSDGEQAVRLGVGEHCRGLVEEKHLGVRVEGPQQLQSLALTHRHRRNRRRRVDLEVEPCGEIGEVVRRLRPRRPPMALGAEQQQVVDGHHRRHEGEVLLHERHAALPGVARRRRGEWCARPQQLARRRAVEAAEDAHQGRLARPVLAEDRQHLSGTNVEVDAAKCLDVTEPPGDADDFQGRRRTGVHCYSGMNGTSKDPSLISAVRDSSSSIASGLIRSASSGLMTTSRPSSATPIE